LVYVKKLFPVLVFSFIVFALGCVEDKEDAVDSPAAPVSTTTVAAKVLGEEEEASSTTVEESTSSTTSLRVRVEMPDDVDANCIGFLVGAPDEIQSITVVGGGWVRPHPGPFAWEWIEKSEGELDFRQTDEYVKSAQKNRVGVLATIWPYAGWDHDTCHGKECEVDERDIFYPRAKGKEKEFKKDFKKEPGVDYLKDGGGGPQTGGIPKKRCKPCDIRAYKNFMSKLVERYDGDGVDDMPDLQIPVRYYEILNEPSMQGGDLTFFKGTPKEYVEILKASHEAIKSACDKCAVVQGGASGNHDEPTVFWDKVFSVGGGDYIDVANIHFINYGDETTLNVNDFKKSMAKNGVKKPIWVTESEFKNSDDIDGAVSGALNAGAEKIFFPGFGAGHGPLRKARQFESLYKKQVAKCR